VERTGGLKYRGLVRAFYDGRAARGWLVDYYDDEAWMTMALLRAFDLTGDARYLDTAETIYQDIMTQWDTTCCGTHLGGIWWDKKKSSKATASNAGPVIAGVRLGKRTNKPQYLEFAKKTYDFWMTNMVNQQTWAIYDHLTPDGTRAPGALTYNHGIMIGAGMELSDATGEAHYLTEAHAFAHYMMTNATKPSSAGPVLNDFGTSCTGDCAAWKGIGYRYLALLFRKDPTHADYGTFLANNATAIWTLARATDTNLFNSLWMGPAPTTGGVEAQGSAAMALNLYALLCGSDKNATWPAPGVYEAEESTVNHVALEAKYKNFSGFGYAAAFAKDKQSIVFEVDAAKAGQYSLDFRYSAGAGNATRSVLAAGLAVVPAQAFAATADWDTWASAKATLELPAGKTSVELRFDAAKSGVGAINVDKLTVTAL
jgi:predicted alpha-1,6-mannanase (GH76 family)